MNKVLNGFRFVLLKMAVVMLLFSLFRVLFYLFNYSYFTDLQLSILWGGFRFDWMGLCMLYAPYFLLLLVDFRPKSLLRRIFFHISNTLAILISCMDFEYFKFTYKRTTADLFYTKGILNDLLNLIPAFVRDYWYLFIIAFILIVLSDYLYRRTEKLTFEAPKLKYYLIYFLPLMLFYAIGFRGGIQLKPLNVIQAGQYAQAKNIPLVLNTPFTFLKSAFKEELSLHTYFSEDSLQAVYSPLISLKKDSQDKPMNVVLIIAESFSKEYIGAFNDGDGYTPFLDQLISKSLVFEHSLANGKKSIEALPAILSGIPTLMNSSYISSNYGGNKIQGLGHLLKAKGYRTAFYHGGENGTMGFNAFAQMSGIEEYFGRSEYPNEDDYDGKWGIFDEPFLQFSLENISAGKKPFFASIFTLSSHHPYTVPKPYQDRFTGGPLPILKSVQYADYALQRFFEAAEKEEWFDNTVFVITADHTSQSFRESYNNRIGMYEIPIIFYAPKHLEAARKDELAQQTDLYPSIMDLIGYEGELLAFGGSVFQTGYKRFNVSYLNGLYQLIEGDFVVHFDGQQSIAFYNWRTDPQLENNLLEQKLAIQTDLERKLKAIIQQYEERITQNRLIP